MSLLQTEELKYFGVLLLGDDGAEQEMPCPQWWGHCHAYKKQSNKTKLWIYSTINLPTLSYDQEANIVKQQQSYKK